MKHSIMLLTLAGVLSIAGCDKPGTSSSTAVAPATAPAPAGPPATPPAAGSDANKVDSSKPGEPASGMAAPPASEAPNK